jgi:hypothetical protein
MYYEYGRDYLKMYNVIGVMGNIQFEQALRNSTTTILLKDSHTPTRTTRLSQTWLDGALLALNARNNERVDFGCFQATERVSVPVLFICLGNLITMMLDVRDSGSVDWHYVRSHSP